MGPTPDPESSSERLIHSEDGRSVHALGEMIRLQSMRLLVEHSSPSGLNATAVLRKQLEILLGLEPLDPVHSCEEEWQQAEDVRRSLLSNVVFIVFNFTPLRRPERRVFVAGLVSRNIDKTLRGIAGGWPVRHAMSSEDEGYCEIMVSPKANDVTEAVETGATSLWQEKWLEYYRVTREGVKESRYTWNQFLLKAAARPRTMGLTIGEQQVVPWYYASLQAADLEAIGIPRSALEIHERAQVLMELGDTSLPSTPTATSGLQMLTARWAACEPSDPAIPVHAPWAAFQLLRHYMFWGGNAFVSIPVTFGAYARNGTAVLSLQTLHPLDERLLTRWSVIASNVFSPVLAEEAVAMTSAAERVKVYEATGHTLKSVVNITAWPAMRDDLRFLGENLATLKLNEGQTAHLMQNVHQDSRRPTRTPCGILRQAGDAFAAFSFAESLGGLIRLISTVEAGNWTKVTDWLDEAELRRWNGSDSAIIESYAVTIFEIAKMACRTFGWPLLRLEIWNALPTTCATGQVPDPTAVKLWNRAEDTNDSISPGALVMPPFRRYSDAGMALLPAILEPTVNAAKASRNDRSVDWSIPIQLRLWGDLPRRIRLEVGNPFSRPLNGLLPQGVRDTADLIERIGIAEFAQRIEAERIGDRRYINWVRLDLTPQVLADRISTGIRGNT